MTTVPSEEAIDAMLLALQANGCTIVGNRPDEHLTHMMMRSVLGTVLVAGAEHLTPVPARPLTVLAEEIGELSTMLRENLAGATWRTALTIAAECATASPTDKKAAAAQILEDAQWFAHHLGNPPVSF